MNSVAGTRSLPRWVIYAALWLLLSCVFASQLFLAGYVTPWSRAFASEAVYWLSWGAMLPVVFWWCRRLRERGFATRVAGLVAGAAIATVLEPLVCQAIVSGQASMQLCFGECELGPQPFSAAMVHAGSTRRGSESAGLCGFRACVVCGNFLPGNARPAVESGRARVAAAPGAARSAAQPAQSAFSLQYAALHRRTGAFESKTCRATHRPAGGTAPAGPADLDTPGTHARGRTRIHSRLRGNRTDAPRRATARDLGDSARGARFAGSRV